jgi:hypothetical protein
MAREKILNEHIVNFTNQITDRSLKAISTILGANFPAETKDFLQMLSAKKSYDTMMGVINPFIQLAVKNAEAAEKEGSLLDTQQKAASYTTVAAAFMNLNKIINLHNSSAPLKEVLEKIEDAGIGIRLPKDPDFYNNLFKTVTNLPSKNLEQIAEYATIAVRKTIQKLNPVPSHQERIEQSSSSTRTI